MSHRGDKIIRINIVGDLLFLDIAKKKKERETKNRFLIERIIYF